MNWKQKNKNYKQKKQNSEQQANTYSANITAFQKNKEEMLEEINKYRELQGLQFSSIQTLLQENKQLKDRVFEYAEKQKELEEQVKKLLSSEKQRDKMQKKSQGLFEEAYKNNFQNHESTQKFLISVIDLLNIEENQKQKLIEDIKQFEDYSSYLQRRASTNSLFTWVCAYACLTTMLLFSN